MPVVFLRLADFGTRCRSAFAPYINSALHQSEKSIVDLCRYLMSNFSFLPPEKEIAGTMPDFTDTSSLIRSPAPDAGGVQPIPYPANPA
jgi:hypothetical protein